MGRLSASEVVMIGRALEARLRADDQNVRVLLIRKSRDARRKTGHDGMPGR